MKAVIIGGGVIGLSIAYELAKREHDVTLVEKSEFGKEASWAGAGIMIPANAETAIHPMEHLEALSHQVHETWATELLQKTQIDNGYRTCGGLYLARSVGEIAALLGSITDWSERKIEFEELELDQLESKFNFENSDVKKAVWVPGESQISNPLHLKALVAACQELGVSMRDNVTDVDARLNNNSMSISIPGEEFDQDAMYVYAAGPWTEQATLDLGVPLPMQPVRGQIALYKVAPELVSDLPIVNEGSRYIVPRRDGHVLAGSTIEEVGFDKSTTEQGVTDVRKWAQSLVNLLTDETFVKAWAGLRPATYDGFPYLGRLGEIENAFVATGHFKGGLHLSTGTAILIADLIEDKVNSIDISCLSPDRAIGHQSTEIK